MRKLLIQSLLLSLFIVLNSHTALAKNGMQSADKKAYDEIRNTVDTFLYGASVNDSDAHRKFWAEDLTYTSSSGTRFGWPQMQKGLTDEPAVDESAVTAWYTGEDYEFKSLGDAVLVNFTLVLTPDAESESQASITRYYNTGVLVKRDGRWQAINWNATTAAAKD